VYVTDFGLAVRKAHGHAADLDFAGTPAYMAPEMYEGRVSPRSDVYAMGVMAFQLLTGSTPFSGTFQELHDKHVREPLPSDVLRARGVRPEVVEVVERATNKQAMFRYKTAPDFARALRDAAQCGMPDLARARKQLCDLVAGRTAESAGGEPTAVVGPGGGATEHRLTYRAGDAVDDGSSLYTETISRIATIKRERRMHPGAEGDGSSIGLPAAAPAVAPVTAVAPRYAPPPVVVPAHAPGAQASVVPAPVLALAVVAIVYGALVAVWRVGQWVGASGLPHPPPASADQIPVFAWVAGAALASFALAATATVAGAACFRPRPWARRLMVRYAVADLAFQLIVFLVAVAWVGPVTASHVAASGTQASPAERATLGASVYLSWATSWLVLSLFPAAALFVMTRRRVRDVFTHAAPVEQ
jgi:serine/threonine-protein kinase